MLLRFSFIIFTLLFSNLTFAKAKKGITFTVELSPAGSFEVKSSKIKGKVYKKSGKLQATNLSVKVSSLNSGLDLRDKHLKEKMEMDKHPKVVVEKAVATGGKGQAIINIKGIKKKIGFVYKELGKYVQVKFKINLKDFKFAGINYMGVGVKEDIIVQAIVPLKNK